MTTAVEGSVAAQGVAPAPSRSRLAFQVLIAVAGLGLTIIVAWDGIWLWRIVRVLVVGAIAAGLMALVHHRSLPIAALAAGLVTTPIGAAVGVPFLRITGLSVRSVAGVFIAAAGLGLVVLSTAALVRAVRGWKRVLVIPLVVLLGYATGPALLVAVAATNVPRKGVGRDTPADRGLDFVDATFVTSDGVTLWGWYIPSGNGAAVALVAGKVADESHADEAIRVASPGNVEVWVVPGATHTGGLGAQPAAWETRVTSFLDRALAVR